MKQATIWIGGALLGLALAQAVPATAQVYNPYDPSNPYSANGPYRRQQPYTIEVPPPPLLPNSSGLLERDFEQMRRTSPNPNAFMGGRWNPGHVTVYPSTSYFTPGFGYGYGGYYPYGGYYGGVLLPSPYGAGSLYGSGYSPYGYTGLGGGYGGVNNYNYNVALPAISITPAPTTPSDTATPTKPKTGDDYYLRGTRSAESLSDALDDIRKAWLNGDLGRLQARVPTDGKVRIFASGEYRYTLDGGEFTSMLKDAMKRIDTVSFDLDRPTSTDRNRARVTGRHTYVNSSGTRETVPVSYVLELVNGRWVITEAGSGTAATVAPAPRGD